MTLDTIYLRCEPTSHFIKSGGRAVDLLNHSGTDNLSSDIVRVDIRMKEIEVCAKQTSTQQFL